jgi:hypothetical protein
LALVFLDRERWRALRGALVAIAAAVVGICLSVRIATGTLLCLLTIDYVWNAWHFAAQHHGIYRIYARRGAARGVGGLAISGLAIEKWALRGFLLYVILRVAGATWPGSQVDGLLATADWLVAAIPVWLLWREAVQLQPQPGRSLYLVSVVALYASLLAAVHWNRPALVLSLTTASALFHATEYLALVAWNVRGRHAALGDRLGLLAWLAPQWGLALCVLVLVLGSSGWLLTQHWLRPWLLANVVVAFLHYAYDGLIWRKGGGG